MYICRLLLTALPRASAYCASMDLVVPVAHELICGVDIQPAAFAHFQVRPLCSGGLSLCGRVEIEGGQSGQSENGGLVLGSTTVATVAVAEQEAQ